LGITRESGVVWADARVIYPGINLGLFGYCERWALGPRITFIVPGRVHKVKGIHDAIEAVAQVSNCLPEHVAYLKIMGPVNDVEYRSFLLRKCAELRMTERVSFIGAVDYKEMASTYHEADICLFLSHQREGLSRVPLEAMACGTLVITTGREGSREFIRHGETGFVVPCAAPRAVATTVKQLVGDQALYRRVVHQARCEVEERFSLERAVDEIEQVLFDAVGAAESALAPFQAQHGQRCREQVGGWSISAGEREG
jgi:glycosyltransferase involved in cell wall biosynthesis